MHSGRSSWVVEEYCFSSSRIEGFFSTSSVNLNRVNQPSLNFCMKTSSTGSNNILTLVESSYLFLGTGAGFLAPNFLGKIILN